MSSDSVFFFSSRRRHTRWTGDWSSDVCSSDLTSKRHLQASRWQALQSTDICGLPSTRLQMPLRGSSASHWTQMSGFCSSLFLSRSEERRVGKEGIFGLLRYTVNKKVLREVGCG